MDTAYILQVLLPYLISLYIIDSITYIGRHQRLFVSSFGGRFKIRSGGVYLAGLSPLCQAADSHILPILLTLEGIYVPAGSTANERVYYQKEDLRFLSYGDLKAVEAAGKSLTINGSISFKTPSPAFSRNIARRLESLRDARGRERENIYSTMLEEETDTVTLARRREELTRSLFAISLLSSTLFLFVFFILPLAVYRLIDVNVSLLLFLMAPVYCAILWSTYRIHKRFFPLEREERFYLLIAAVLLPVSALHVASRLTRGMYAGYDFLAVAALLLPKDALRALFRKELNKTRFALNDDNPGDLREYWLAREETLLRLVKRAGFSPGEICGEQEKKDEFAQKYCPLCAAEYRAGFDRCADCSVVLAAF